MACSTPQRLVEAAYELFARNGFHAIGLDRIFDEVGISKQTFYNHFECKDDLVLAVLKRRSEWEIDSMRGMIARFGGDDPRSRLYAIFDALDAWLNDPEFKGCIFNTAAAEFPSQHDPAHQAARAHELAIHRLVLELAQNAGADNPRALAEGLQILMSGALIYRHITGDNRAAEIARVPGLMLLEKHLPPVEQPAPVDDDNGSLAV